MASVEISKERFIQLEKMIRYLQSVKKRKPYLVLREPYLWNGYILSIRERGTLKTKTEHVKIAEITNAHDKDFYYEEFNEEACF